MRSGSTSTLEAPEKDGGRTDGVAGKGEEIKEGIYGRPLIIVSYEIASSLTC
jgi:hypothetical protein